MSRLGKVLSLIGLFLGGAVLFDGLFGMAIFFHRPVAVVFSIERVFDGFMAFTALAVLGFVLIPC